MFECRSKHIYNESLGGKRSPDFSNRKSDKIMKKVFRNNNDCILSLYCNIQAETTNQIIEKRY